MPDRDAKGRLSDWFLKWRQPLRKFLSAKGAVPPADLDDVAQEVFLRLMRYGQPEHIERPQAYLYKMASNVAAEWAIRGRHSRTGDAEWLAGLAGEEAGETVSDEAGHFELQDEVERALATLTPQQRAVLKLQFYSGLRRKEIAQRLNLTERSVKRAQIKGYARLRDELGTQPFGKVSHGRE